MILPASKIPCEKETGLDSQIAMVIFVWLTGIIATREQVYDKSVPRPDETGKPSSMISTVREINNDRMFNA